MKITSTILCDFIQDYKLEVSEVGVCFDAIIDFNLPLQNFNLPSEVYMESVFSNSIDTIYLLNPVIELYKLPVYFNDVNYQFLYVKHRGILIAGNLPLFGTFTISIIPKCRTCTQKTFNELRAKKLN